jgi:predicted permease
MLKKERANWKPQLWLIHLVGAIVPRRLRADWRQEWEAELRRREALLAEWERLGGRAKLDLWRRSLGAFRDALWMQPRRWEDGMIQDLRYAIRSIVKHRGSAMIAISMLALGVGANTALFSMVKSVLIEPLPFAQPERLLQARLYSQAAGTQDDWVNHLDMLDWRAQGRSFESVSAYRFAMFNLAEGGPPEASYGLSVSQELLPTLGVRPALGRYFLPEEDRPGRNRVVILSDDLWRRRFGARRDIVGQTIRANDESYVVVGVMPPGFNFPLRLATEARLPSRQMAFWTPMGADAGKESRDNTNCNVILRLKPGTRPEQAQAELDGIMARLAQAYPQSNSGRGARLVSLKAHTIGGADRALLVLFGAVGLVLLMVCANIASLLLTRADGRRKEMAIRQALGAGRWRLARQALTESLTLALIGGATGVALAEWSLRALLRLGPHDIPRLAETRIDAEALGFALAVTTLAGLLFGVAPAMRAARACLNDTLKVTASAVGARRGAMRSPGNLLVASEVAIALSLTLAAGLLLNSFARLTRIDPGFRAEGATAAILVLPRTRYPDVSSNVEFFRRVVERLEAAPGVEAAGASNSLPLSGHGQGAFLEIEGRPLNGPNDPATLSAAHRVSANYLRAIGVPLLRGRLLDAHDAAGAPTVAVISDTAARRFWPGEDPIGKRFRFGEWRQVVGVVRDTHRKELDASPLPEIYVPLAQAPNQTDVLVARASLPPAMLAARIREAVEAVDKDQPVFLTVKMEDLVADAVAKQRFAMRLLGAFSGLALALATLGIYGVVSYGVARRTREIGVRMALGAQRADVLRMILAQGMRPVLLGAAGGALAALAFGRALSGMLYGVTAADPETFAVVGALLLIVASLACFAPARRAARVDPQTALRDG